MSYPLVSLGNLAKFINGDRGKNYPSKDSFVDEGIPFINAGCLSDQWILDSSKFNYISEEAYTRLSSGKIQRNDILFCLRGSVGKFAVIRDDDKGALASSLVILRANEKVNVEYLKHYLASSLCKKELDNYQNGAAQPNLSANDFKKFLIPLPSIEEQHRIASILDKADELCQKRQKAIEKLDQLLQATFIDMFGDPVSNPKGWEVKTLESLTTKIGSGSTPKGGDSSYKDEGISLIRSLNIYDGQFSYKNLAFIDDDQADKLKNVILRPKDVLLNITGASVARCCIVPNDVLPARVNQHVSILRTKEILMPEFLEALLISKPMKLHLLKTSGAGATREALTKLQLQELQIIVPPLKVQNEFLLKLKSIKYQIAINLKQLNDLDKLFTSSQNQAFSGTL